VTPDLLPILGPDPEEPRLLYACGHSRNGILMAPLCGDVLADLVEGHEPAYDLRPFGVERFVGVAG
jgi:glycine/D-amino acid oxidase-like deaminating enzyme